MILKIQFSTVNSIKSIATMLVSLGLLTATTSAEAKMQYVKTKEGEKPLPIVAIDNVCAWPNLTVLPDGAIIATIHNKPSHLTEPADVECWASTDGGQTWQKRGTPAPHEPNTNRGMFAAGVAKNGDLIVISTGHHNEYPPGKSGPPYRAGTVRAWVSRSADGGRTWAIDKQPAVLDKDPGGSHYHGFGDILAGNDGALRLAAYAGEHPPFRSYVFRSPDDGKTWSEPVRINHDDVSRDETAIFHLGGGKWLAAARDNGLNLYASTDDTRTWKPRECITDKQQHPGHFLRLADGRLLLSYGNRLGKDKGVEIVFSDDDGKTWSDPVRVLDVGGDCGYPSSVQLPDGQVLTAYYASSIKGHNRYHMGVVIWDPETSLPRK